MTRIDIYLLGLAVLLLLSVLISRLSGRLGIPALLIFIGIGMLAGSEGPGGIRFDNTFIAQSVGVTALAIILFDGGLRTEWERVRPTLWRGVVLATIGVLLTAMVTGVFAKALFSFTWKEALLLGSIMSSTDAAAVFSILRSRKATLRGKARPLLELESGSNDPMAVFLTVGFVQLVSQPHLSALTLLPLLFRQFALALLAGLLGGRFFIWVINRLKLEYEGLYPVFTTAAMLLLYSSISSLGGSGFLAVYVAGIVMGKGTFIHKNSLMRFHDGLAWLAQIAMFLTLGLLVFPSHLMAVAGSGLLTGLFMMLIARPASAWLCLLGGGLSHQEKLMVSWVGLRGAAPIILATFPFFARLPQAELLFNIVFFVVLLSVLVQGTTIPWIARILKLSVPIPPREHSPIELETGTLPDMELQELTIPQGAWISGQPLYRLSIPRRSLVVLVTRGEHFLIPRGGTLVKEGDVLLVLASKEDLNLIREMLANHGENPR